MSNLTSNNCKKNAHMKWMATDKCQMFIASLILLPDEAKNDKSVKNHCFQELTQAG